jgi:hypothetical protein
VKESTRPIDRNTGQRTRTKAVNGRPTQLRPGHPDFIDYYGRPWAKNWETFFEAGWGKPQEELPAAITDIFGK